MTKKDIKAFFKAITDSDLNRVSNLLNSDKDYITVCNVAPPKKDDGQSGLQVAFKTGNFDIAKLLIERGADVNLQDQEGDTALHRAAQNGNDRILKMLLVKGANPNLKNKVGGTALMWAAAFGHDESVTVLLDNGADPKLKDEDGVTASGWAAKNKREELSKRLRESERR